MKNKILSKKLGQNTAEYILMLVLVAGAALASFKLFGGVIQERFDAVMASMQGRKHNIEDVGNKDRTADYYKTWDVNAQQKNSDAGGGAGSGSGSGSK